MFKNDKLGFVRSVHSSALEIGDFSFIFLAYVKIFKDSLFRSD